MAGADRDFFATLGVLYRKGVRYSTVIDVGCGTGLSFEALHRAVGMRGRIIGIEQSPEMIGKARDRVQRHGWRNVTLLNAPA